MRFVCWSGPTFGPCGRWWLGIWRYRVIILTPKALLMFSERQGFVRTFRLPFGWRIKFERLRP